MARGGVYKSDVQKARRSLLAQGKHPSVDALRVELGNTGSKTTIHRYLKEIEEEEGQGVGTKVAVSDALQDLVVRLAARLHEEAEVLITEANQRFETELAQRNQMLEHSQEEAAAMSAQLQRTEIALRDEQATHDATRQALAERVTEVAQLGERIAGMTLRLTEHESHARSLEEKHQHAREALEHYRTSAKEQRDQEQRRHEHQVQGLQVELRQAQEGLTAKNHELMQLNRDNVQWLERHGRLERELIQVRQASEALRLELDALGEMAAEHQVLKKRWADDTQALNALRSELASARTGTAKERDRRELAEADALRANVRLETLERLLAQLRTQERDPETPMSVSVATSETSRA